MYNYVDSKNTIKNILNSKTDITKKSKIPASDNEFTYENGVRVWVGALFIDIVDSSKLFKDANEDTARMMRAFCSETISILKDNSNYYEIGIRGDCVYAVYNAAYQIDLLNIYNDACRINTFMRMLNKLLKQNDYPEISVGIGLGCDEELVVKAGKSGTGINDKIWIGKALVDASHYADKASREFYDPIAMSSTFYNNISEMLINGNPKYKDWITYSNSCYHCNTVNIEFDKWIDNNL